MTSATQQWKDAERLVVDALHNLHNYRLAECLMELLIAALKVGKMTNPETLDKLLKELKGNCGE